MMTEWKQVNGHSFRFTQSQGPMRFSNRHFIDGKRVSRNAYLEALDAARRAEREAFEELLNNN